MKQLLLFMLCSGALSAGAQQAVADVDHAHIAHEIFDNLITVGLENVDCKLLKLSVDQGSLRTGPDACTFIYNTDQTGTAVFTVSKKEGNEYKTVGRVTYQVRPMPLPTPFVAGKNKGAVPVTHFKAQDGMIARLDGFDFDARCKIASFRMEVIRDGRVYLDAQNNNSIFEPATRTVISRVLPGDKIAFSNIICYKPNKKEVELEPFTLDITK